MSNFYQNWPSCLPNRNPATLRPVAVPVESNARRMTDHRGHKPAFIFCVPPPPDIRERTLERTNGMHRVNQMLGEEREHAWSYEPVNLIWGLTCSLRSGILLLFIIENSFAATAVRVHPPP